MENRTPSPLPNQEISQKHHDTPTRAGIQAVKRYCARFKYPCTARQLYQVFGVPGRSQRRILASRTPRTAGKALKEQGLPEKRGRKRAIPEDMMQDVIWDLKEGAAPVADLNWKQLAARNGIFTFNYGKNDITSILNPSSLNQRRQSQRLIQKEEEQRGTILGLEDITVSHRTFQKEMHARGYGRFMKQQTGYATSDLKTERVEWARRNLEDRPNPEDWRNIAWSDEYHFPIHTNAKPKRETRHRRSPGFPQKRARNSRQRSKQERETGITRTAIHAWIFISYEHRGLYFYNVTNKTGKMTAQCYITQCLPNVRGYLREHGFLLQEDCDGTHNSKLANQYKEIAGISCFKQVAVSPDLSVAETFARSLKARYDARGHYHIEEAREAVISHFFDIPQSYIQKWINEMPKRLKMVIEMDGEYLPNK